LEYIDIVRKLLTLWNTVPKHYEGSIMGSMTTYPHSLAIYAYNLFIHTNLADPVTFKEIAYLEEDVIVDLSKLYSALEPAGFITSGGTESNIIALYTGSSLYMFVFVYDFT